MADVPITELFAELAYLCDRLNVRPAHMDGCWEFDAGEFKVSFNGHKDPMKNSRGLEAPGFNAIVEANGWPLGCFGISGGALIASGRDESTEELLIKALQAKMPEPISA